MSTPRLRALTLWPEWAWAVHHLDKRVENRTWALPVGEWFALHAGKHIGGRPGSEAALDGLHSLKSMANRAGWRFDTTLVTDEVSVDRKGRVVAAKIRTIQTSAILGLFRVTRTEASNQGDLTGWRVPDQVGNIFEYRPLSLPVPCRGAQGLWVVPPDVAERVLSTINWTMK